MRILSRLYACALAAAALVIAPAAFAATAGVDAAISARIDGAYAGANDLASVVATFDQRAAVQVAPGVGAGKADRLFSDTRTIAASSTENLDLAGVLADPLGSTLTFAKVKAIYVKASSANTNSVVLGGAGSNGFLGPFADASDVLTIPPGGFVLLVHPGAGWAVTASTADLLKVANSSSGTGVTYDVVIIGVSS